MIVTVTQSARHDWAWSHRWLICLSVLVILSAGAAWDLVSVDNYYFRWASFGTFRFRCERLLNCASRTSLSRRDVDLTRHNWNRCGITLLLVFDWVLFRRLLCLVAAEFDVALLASWRSSEDTLCLSCSKRDRRWRASKSTWVQLWRVATIRFLKSALNF